MFSILERLELTTDPQVRQVYANGPQEIHITWNEADTADVSLYAKVICSDDANLTILHSCGAQFVQASVGKITAYISEKHKLPNYVHLIFVQNYNDQEVVQRSYAFNLRRKTQVNLGE